MKSEGRETLSTADPSVYNHGVQRSNGALCCRNLTLHCYDFIVYKGYKKHPLFAQHMTVFLAEFKEIPK
jgi:hypothetical protein